MASEFTSSQCCRVDVESHSARCITNGISKITPYILFHGLAATPPFGGVQCIFLYIAGACAPAYWLPPRGSYLILHNSRGFRLRQAYAVTNRRLRGSTPGLFYDAGAQKVGSLTLAGAPHNYQFVGGPEFLEMPKVQFTK